MRRPKSNQKKTIVNRPLVASGVAAIDEGTPSPRKVAHERGVALVLVIFVVALASILVVNLAYSTYIGARLNAGVQRSVQAEYYLKSALNLARLLIRADHTADDDPNDPWWLFLEGVPIPAEMLGLSVPNLRVQLEIRPEESKLPLRAVNPTGGTPDPVWLDVFTRLFQELGFDSDGEKDVTGLTSQVEFGSKEMLANLIDYVDQDTTSYNVGQYRGIESDLKSGTFPNTQLTRVEELAAVPGFTPARVQKLLPLVTVRGQGLQLNINTAPKRLIAVLHANFTPANADQIDQFRRGPSGPFKRGGGTGVQSQLQQAGVNSQDAQEIDRLILTGSVVFQVLAKVDYETSNYFLRAYVRRDTNTINPQLPQVLSVELF